MPELTDVTGETLRRWREGKGWDVPRMARELRKAARDSGEDVAAHHGLVKMIPQWERGGRVPRERYRLLYRKIFDATLGDMSQDVSLAADAAMRLAELQRDRGPARADDHAGDAIGMGRRGEQRGRGPDIWSDDVRPADVRLGDQPGQELAHRPR